MKGTLDMTENTKESFMTRCADTTPRDQRNLRRMMWVLAAWAVLFLAATMGIKRELYPEGPVLWIVAALPMVAGILVVVAYARFLREADELQRVIHYQALALACGAGWLAVSLTAILEKMNALASGTDLTILAMAIAYSAWILIGQVRYR